MRAGKSSLSSMFVTLLAAAFGLFVQVAQASTEKRVALVVGNSAYEHIAPLRNPSNDAADLIEKLKPLGFQVFGGTDLDRRSLVKALIDFGRAAGEADTALFYYAGHGVQVNGENYLVPVDALVEFEEEIDISLVTLSNVMRQLERGSKTNIIFLDACRNNPFEDKLKVSSTRAAIPMTKGLTRVQSGRGTFIAYATQPDAVASDGNGRNSPFTTALLSHIGTPGQTISDMMIEVRNDVMKATNNVQIPWDSSSLTGRFVFAAGAEAAPAPASAAPPPAAATVNEKEAYDLAVSIGTCGAFEAFVRRFPDSFFTDLAKEQAASACAPEEEVAAADASDGQADPQPQSETRGAALNSTTLSMVTPQEEETNEICADGPDSVSYCASSVLAPQGRNKYDPSMLFDGQNATAWVEDDEGSGIGQTITLYFDGERTVSGFDILNGYDKDEKTWTNNSRVKGATLELSTGESFQIELPDVRRSNRFAFSQPLKAEWLSITIDSVYRGQKFADTAISELAPVFVD